ncbi:MAG: aminotransferase [Flavobacteriaceae bacterium]|nr:aminotransferase [Flavobacteriaceae bacterium]
METHKKEFFELPDDIVFLNGAYMSPQLKSVAQIGIENLRKKGDPSKMDDSDFFGGRLLLKQRFAQLIAAETHQRIAIIPSVSYGIATAVQNIPFQKKDEIVVLEEQFPSNYYAWKQLERETGVTVVTVKAPPLAKGRGAAWNDAVLAAINHRTKAVAMPQVHWADGTWFDLKAVKNRCDEVGAYLIIDGTQSVGAMPFSVDEIRPDALICGGYKWLMGGYGLGVAYFGERFDGGRPLENNWMNHEGAEDFATLSKYNENFKPMAERYNVGESSNFILTNMLSEAIRQLLEWTPEAIQQYCRSITELALRTLEEKGYYVESPDFRGHHLFGIYPMQNDNLEAIKIKLKREKIAVSYRGDAIRVSPNVYNTRAELEKLVACLVS